MSDGGPAFPFVHNENPHAESGMTLRDYFAASALNGLLANSRRYQHIVLDQKEQIDEYLAACVVKAFWVADKALKSRDEY